MAHFERRGFGPRIPIGGSLPLPSPNPARCRACERFDAAERAAIEERDLPDHDLVGCTCNEREIDLLYVSPTQFRMRPQVGTPCRMTIDMVAAYLERPSIGESKDAAGAISMALYQDNVRQKETLTHVWAISADVDENGDVDHVADALANYNAVVHSTFHSCGSDCAHASIGTCEKWPKRGGCSARSATSRRRGRGEEPKEEPRAIARHRRAGGLLLGGGAASQGGGADEPRSLHSREVMKRKLNRAHEARVDSKPGISRRCPRNWAVRRGCASSFTARVRNPSAFYAAIQSSRFPVGPLNQPSS